jgi:trimeric autotransporter adhesin
MADIRTSSLGGVPKGETADRPSSPSIGDVFYNGTLGCLEIYTSQGWVANSAPPGIPTIGTATYSATNKAYNNASASVSFTPGEGGGLPNLYRATSSPGGFSGTATSSPISVSGLQSGVAYTFSVTGTNNFGTSAGSTNSNSITANTVPQAPGTPTATYYSGTQATLTFTAGGSGGTSITNYEYSTDGTNFTALSPAQTSSPLIVSGLTEFNNYTFTIKAVNSSGKSTASDASNQLYMGPILSGGTLSSDSTYYYRTFTANGNLSVTVAPITLNILAIAGGGSGGVAGGGGGSGAAVHSSSRTLSPQSYSLTIGGGSSAATTNGTNTTFGSLITANGGGAGGNSTASNTSMGAGIGYKGENGGSGGGAGRDFAAAGSADNASSGGTVYGYNGGGSPNTGWGGAGGGGGTGAIGQNGVGNGQQSGERGGAGGSGTNVFSSWLSAITPQMTSVSGWSTATSTGFIGGGGGGGCQGTDNPGLGGAGGGGKAGSSAAGSTNPTAQNGTTNTGSGGGGHGGGSTNAAGGSGIIIVRYTKASVGG